MPTPLPKLAEQIKASRTKLQATAKAREAAGGPVDSRTMNYIAEAMKQLAGNGTGRKHDPTGSPIANYYGNGGVFSYPYANPNVISTVIQPMSYWSTLPMKQSRVQNEVREYLTGAPAGSGSNPTNVCGNPPTPGGLLTCRVWTPFGQYFAGTQVVDVTQVGLMDTHAAQPREIENLIDAGGWFVPQPLATPGANLASEAAIQLFTLSTMLARQGATVEIDGDPSLAYNASEIGWIKEPRGISRIITDGYTDVTGTACPALDSLVVDWDAAVDADESDAYAGNLPSAMHDMYFMLANRARLVGFGDVRFHWLMDEQLFHRLTFVFACTYALARCGDASAGNPISREMAVIESRQVEMRRGQYLLIGGVPVPVRFTTGYEVDRSVNPQVGSIYLVPEYGNGRDLTYLEYFPMDNPDARAFNQMGNTTGRFYSNNGLFAFATRSSGFCDQWLVTYRPRMIIETPFLAGRFDNISFAAFTGFRSPFPGNSSYVNGGTAAFTATFAP